MNSNTPQKIIKLSELRRPNTINSLKNLLSTPDTSLAINVPCPNLDFPRWHIDIAHDYLASLVVGESLAQYCKNIEANFEGLRTVFFTFNTKDIINLEDFITKLIWLDKGFKEDAPDASVDSEDERDDYDYDYEEFRGEMEDFADKIETLQLNFPELGDKYMANIIPGQEEISGDDVNLEAIYFKHPERQYEFWRSCASSHLGYDFYVSTWGWIILHDLDSLNIHRNLAIPLAKFGGFVDGIPNLEDAQWVAIGNLPSIVFNENVMACYPLEGVRQAQECAASIWNLRFRDQPDYINKGATRTIYNITKNGFYSSQNKVHVKLSEDGYVLIVIDTIAQYVFFKEKYYSFRLGTLSEEPDINFLEEISERGKTLWEVPTKSQRPFWIALDKFSETLGRFEGNPIDVKLNWSEFDDEKFEQLCYDILQISENFNPDTARKMGNSRSRDGGRDIEIFTRQRINVPPKKWIVQCKFSKSNRALPASKMSISDVIDEHNVQGFCVMTNTLIDSTLHDRLEKISQNRSIEFDEWDVLRIERTLARPRYRNIKKRYFEK